MNDTQPANDPIVPGDLHYTGRPGFMDETLTSAGEVKPEWVYLMDALRAMGPELFAHRTDKARRILRDDGATYNIYNDLAKPARTWDLDLVPFLIRSEDWVEIESGLLERSELFNLLYKDIYGPRNLIRQGVIPPEALFAHSGFLRACQGIDTGSGQSLVMHSVDLVRGPGGRPCVLTDRIQSPSGSGYALENRTVMSRVLPSLFRDSHVHRLAGYFQSLRRTLVSLSPQQDNPRIVVLTPGSHNETYFEHAYIANYLGFHLVQSGDLIVKNGYVWMKSLDGLSRVDVIMRRVDDSYCDPVELRGDSYLGVPSLLEVIRAGRVAIANPLGVGILENPVFLKYLPAISQSLLGRDLRMASVDTYWCFDSEDMEYIQDNLTSLVIKNIDRNSRELSVAVNELEPKAVEQLRKKLQQNPVSYVAQPLLNATRQPTFVDGELQPRPSILRTFAVASEGSYSVLPGGLTRVGAEDNSFLIASQMGAKSKDTWVIASEPERVISNQDGDDVPAREADLISLPSRVVENMFWMGRYAERAEASLRILRTVFMLLNGEEPLSDRCKRILLQAVTEITVTQPGFVDASDEMIQSPEEELLLVVKDGDRVGSVRSTLNAMLFCADESKELLSSDTLRVINDIRDALNELDTALSGGLSSAPEEALDPLVTALMALSGLAKESMVRDFGWRFMDTGRRLERSLQTTTLVKNLLTPEVSASEQSVLISAMLLSLEALISYRRRYRAKLGVQSSLDLVLLDTSNPRSLLYQLETLKEHIGALPKPSDLRHELTAEERAILEAETSLKLTFLTDLSSREEGRRKELEESLDRIANLLECLSNFISDKFFDHREVSQQLVKGAWGDS
ncbi:MAG: circularly permuted type 2 ATP-grasp protein [Candidatus Pelagadaptatus aseana]|uniref:circularly permuted type 2 ATP-grasp protein n=1 Tax=Candidatus Pelagadaptatus aseana TaxID=3120508 RepID=UPI0039B2A719